MNWTLKSPGIWTSELHGFLLHRIADAKVPGKRIDCKGEREMIQQYQYTAVRQGTKERPFQRFAGSDIDKIVKQILQLQVKTLF